MVKKDLKDLCIRMIEHESIKFPGSGTDRSRNAHPNMGTLVGQDDLLSAQCPSSSRSWISLHTCLIKKPNVSVRIGQEDLEQFDKCLSLFLVLSVRPRARHLEPESFFMEPTKQGAIADFVIQLFRHVSMKLLTRPMYLVGFLRVLDQIPIFCTFFRTDLPGPTCSRTVDQPVNTLIIEAVHPAGDCTFGDVMQLGRLVMRKAQTQSSYGAHTHVSALTGGGLHRNLQIS